MFFCGQGAAVNKIVANFTNLKTIQTLTFGFLVTTEPNTTTQHSIMFYFIKFDNHAGGYYFVT